MKKWMLLLLLVSSSAWADLAQVQNQLNQCARQSAVAVEFGFVGKQCGFKNPQQSHYVKLHADTGCDLLLGNERTRQLGQLVLTQQNAQMQKLGQKAYCQGKKDSYYQIYNAKTLPIQ